MPASAEITRELLSWYDRHRRTLPWRAEHGAKPDPYAVWLSEIMLQQTTVAAVKPYYATFLRLWPNVRALAEAPREAIMKEWAGLGYYARARNLHDCAAAVVSRHNGRFPANEAQLRDLPGVGDYTAAAIAAIAFGEPATVVDGNVERVATRLFAVEAPLPRAKPLIRTLVQSLVPASRPGDFAQAMMDFGATLCTPKSPACTLCPLLGHCAGRKGGDPTAYPRRLVKRARPLRRGAMVLISRPDGALLVRTRPASGLLGGMTEFVSSPWFETEPDIAPLQALADAGWERRGTVNHVFTHFELRLDVYRGCTALEQAPATYRWVTLKGLEDAALPSVMLKVLRAAQNPPADSALLAVEPDGLGLIGLEGADQQTGRQRENGKTKPRRRARDRNDVAKRDPGGGDTET